MLRQLIAADDQSSPCIHVAAAISLQEAMAQILAAYSFAARPYGFVPFTRLERVGRSPAGRRPAMYSLLPRNSN